MKKWIEVAQSCPTLCDFMDCLQCSSIHGILQARVLEWVAISFSRGSSRPRDWIWVSCIVGRRFTIWATREVHINPSKSLVTLYISICTFCFLVSLLQAGEQKPDVPKQLLYSKRSKDEFSSQGEFSGCCPQFFLIQSPKHQLIQFCTIPPFGSLRLPSVVFFCPFTGLTSQCSFISTSFLNLEYPNYLFGFHLAQSWKTSSK